MPAGEAYRGGSARAKCSIRFCTSIGNVGRTTFAPFDSAGNRDDRLECELEPHPPLSRDDEMNSADGDTDGEVPMPIAILPLARAEPGDLGDVIACCGEAVLTTSARSPKSSETSNL
jgi:hypothetical protein